MRNYEGSLERGTGWLGRPVAVAMGYGVGMLAGRRGGVDWAAALSGSPYSVGERLIESFPVAWEEIHVAPPAIPPLPPDGFWILMR
jgi:hypothetical protein